MTRVVLHNYFPKRARDSRGWVEMRQDVYEKIQVGKTYKFGDGRRGKVIQKAENNGQKSASGWTTGNPMVLMEWKDDVRDGGPGSGPQGGSGPLELTEQAKPHSSAELKKGAKAEQKHKEDFNKQHFEEWKAKQKTSPSPAPKKYEAPKPNKAPLELKDAAYAVTGKHANESKSQVEATGRTLTQYLNTSNAVREYARSEGYNRLQEAYLVDGFRYQRRVDGLSENV